MAEKMRVHILAKELNVPSKMIVEKCKAEGIATVKNHMSTLSAGLHATICEWFSEGTADTAVETAERIDLEKVRRRQQRALAKAAAESVVAVADDPPPEKQEEQSVTAVTAVAEAPAVADESKTSTPVAKGDAAVLEAQAPPTGAVIAEAPPGALEVADLPPVAPTDVPAAGAEDQQIGEKPPSEAGGDAATEVAEVKPAGPQNIPGKAKLQGPRVVRYEAPDRDIGPIRRAAPPPSTGDKESQPSGRSPSPPSTDKTGDKAGTRRRGRLSPRRTAGRLSDTGKRISEWGDRDLAERRERLAGATGRRIHRRRSAQAGGAARPIDTGPKTKATVNEPVRMKEFCSATGSNFIQCLKVLRDEFKVTGNVNMTLPTETAELLALHFGIELTVIPSRTQLDELTEEFAKRERLHLQTRPPVVTMLGHVDHGKTSLLDAIRESRVVDTEDGGITQHIGAYHITVADHAVTFLDTPGHEAFTAMRARGAQLTDVVVLVVAADDGLMPQTIEAINHAKAAEVPIVVALNKIDLGDQNKLKIYGQLAERELTPSGEWGGETDVIATSAKTGVGITELLEHLASLSSLLDLQADPTLAAAGRVIEAETKSGVGSVARILVQEGTLRIGDFVVCGPAFGKVRALLDDRGTRIKEAGPSLPVEVWGLDDVPSAGDMLFVVESMQRAKNIATEMKQSRQERARLQSRKVKTLEEMVLKRSAAEIPELNLIIKGDVDGSVAALRQVLSEIPSDEVNLTIRHAGVGAVTDSDVLLAAACDGLVVAFRVELPVSVRRIAERNGVDVRSYRVIYDVCDDIKKALEGLLEPEEKIEPRATAEVRQVFHVSKMGTVAGSYVTDGVLDRSHFAKIIRDGVVVRERCKFASLRRFKDDAKEVRAGLECGIRLEGFDDVHVGDIVESYEVIKIARTL